MSKDRQSATREFFLHVAAFTYRSADAFAAACLTVETSKSYVPSFGRAPSSKGSEEGNETGREIEKLQKAR
jgi:hypothetical protein